MNFYKTISYTTIYTGIQLLVSLAIGKVTAVINGPHGTVDLGFFNNFLTITSLISSSSMAVALTRGVAVNINNEESQRTYIKTVFGVFTRIGLIISIIIVVLSSWLSVKAFGHPNNKSLFQIYGVAFLAIGSNILFNSILTGLNKIKELTVVNILHAISLLVFSIIFTIKYGVYGTILGNLVSFLIQFFAFMIINRNESWLRKDLFLGKLSWPIIHDFKGLALLGMIGLIVPINESFIRNHIQDILSKHDAGLWSAMIKISNMYLSFIIATLSAYYLPKLASLKEDYPMLIREVRKAFKRIIPLVSLASFLIWLCRDLIIQVLLQKEFNGIAGLFAFQMVGDVIKIAGYLLAFLLTVYKRNTLGIILLISSEIIYYVSTVICIRYYGLIGTSLAFALTMVYYFIFVTICFQNLLVDIKKSVWKRPLKSYFQS